MAHSNQFEQWLARRDIVLGDARGADGCDSCGREERDQRLSKFGDSPFCDICLARSFGAEEFEPHLLDYTLGAAIKECLARLPEETVRDAVERAFREDHERQLEDACMRRAA